MTLYELLSEAQYLLTFSIYVTDKNYQNFLIAKGTRPELMKNDFELYGEEVFQHLMHKVDYFKVTPNGQMEVYIKDEFYKGGIV